VKKSVEKESLPELSIVMPCLNEIHTIEKCISEAQTAIEKHNLFGEVIVADNGSTDGSPQVSERLGARTVHVSKRGYGSALMGGIASARGRFIIIGDSDNSYSFADLIPFLQLLRQGYDLVMGNRFKGGIRPGAMPFLHRYLGNPLLSWIARLFFGCPSGDLHCGLRGFSKEAFTRMNLQTTGMEFASEMVVKATLLKMRIAEVPITLRPTGRKGPSHLRTWRDGWRHLRFLLLYSPKWLFLYPGILLMILGFLAMMLLLPGPKMIGTVGLDVHSLLYAGAAVIIGYQSVLFAIFSKIFALAEELFPPDRRFEKLFRLFTLERGILLGSLLILGGLAAFLWAMTTWSALSFGALEPRQMMRITIPSVVALIVGCQTVLSSFFLSILGIQRK
jgi:glycosyltransferase involved in cell wall biosynthesis